MARNTLILGIVLFALFILLSIAAAQNPNDTSDQSVESELQDVESELQDVESNQLSINTIKDQAISVPYDLLVKHGDIYAGEIIHYTGHVVDVRKNNNEESYAIKVEVYDTDDSIVNDRMIWSNYLTI